MGYPAPEIIQGLKTFTGARRRFELKGKVNGITVIDDYGHHPTEVRVTLETAQNYNPNGRVLAIFQPHRFSRTAYFLSEFAKELSIADKVFLLEVYAASETPIQGVTSLSIAQKMDPTKVIYEPSMPTVIEMVVEMARPEDLIITLGAGDVNSLGPLILEAISNRGKIE
jgi:UDP-N-acetylmuramate--alanine ligase